MNAFEDPAFRDAVKATGRRRLIMAGLHTEICLTFATVEALKDGYDVLYPTDAVGGRSADSPPYGYRAPGARRGGSDQAPWRSSPSCSGTGPGPAGRAALDVIYWYFKEVPQLTDQVGVAEAEKAAAAKHGGH